MSDNIDIFEVEKIVKRKIGDDGELRFFLKWQGYSARSNTWEPRENLAGCTQLLEEFEIKQAKRILNVRRDANRIEYLVEQKDGMPSTIVPSVEAFGKWQLMVLHFLERHISFEVVVKRVNFDVITEAANVIGDPINISYVTDIGTQLQYWCEWPLQKGRFIDSVEAIEKWPHLVYQYLESRLIEVEETDDFKPIGMVTRKQAALAAEFEKKFKLNVVRKVNFDKVLILKQSTRVNRRQTVGSSQQNVLNPGVSILKRKSMAARIVIATTNPAPQTITAPIVGPVPPVVANPAPQTITAPIVGPVPPVVANPAPQTIAAPIVCPVPPVVANPAPQDIAAKNSKRKSMAARIIIAATNPAPQAIAAPIVCPVPTIVADPAPQTIAAPIVCPVPPIVADAAPKLGNVQAVIASVPSNPSGSGTQNDGMQAVQATPPISSTNGILFRRTYSPSPRPKPAEGTPGEYASKNLIQTKPN